ncbi:MAG TPA: rubrerythrin family protein [Bacteroidota bacterium]|nr:rubrerythrin family protein [Bacteroidota bacterium]
MRVQLASLAFGALVIANTTFAATPATLIHLKKAYETEMTTSAKYTAYAQKAREENQPKLAVLFRALARAEAIHASTNKSIVEQLGDRVENVSPSIDIKTTRENLQEAIKAEVKEVDAVYPAYAQVAGDEKLPLAALSINYALKVGEQHRALLVAALNAIDNANVTSLPSSYNVCLTCGAVYGNDCPNHCTNCLTPEEQFMTFK